MELRNVALSLNGKRVLHQINLSWKQGETTALIGANGAGKTTMLKVICLLLKPAKGEVILPNNTQNQWRQELGVVFPESFLYDELTAYENMEFYQRLYGEYQSDKIVELLEAVQLSYVKNEAVGTFSKGMKQRLSIARALLHDPKYLILDEPFDGLDLKSKHILENLLLERKKNGVGWILVSHDIEHAWKLCEKALVMDNGRIIATEQCMDKDIQSFVERFHALLKGNTYEFS
jgi:ABC-type multidrug transport system ATPase subunit